MHKTVRSRLEQLADEQDNRQEHGEPNLALNVVLTNGYTIHRVALHDGSNGLDHQSVDLIEATAENLPMATVWIVPIAQIAAIEIMYAQSTTARVG